MIIFINVCEEVSPALLGVGGPRSDVLQDENEKRRRLKKERVLAETRSR